MKNIKYALGLTTMLSLPFTAGADANTSDIVAKQSALPITFQAEQNTLLYNEARPSQTQRFTATISQNKSSWFWNASTSVTQINHDAIYNAYTHFSPHENKSYEQRYFDFPSLITTGVPILGKALERSLNKAVHKRITKTALYYEQVEAFDRLQAYAETMHDHHSAQYGGELIFSNPLPVERFHNGLFNVAALNARHLQDVNFSTFDSSLYHDVSSVLDHYSAARSLPGVRLRGELGHKTNSFEWRMGLQKQTSNNALYGLEQQKRKSFYSAASWNISERLNYFNVFTQEKFENRFGVEGISNQATSQYHRLSYAINDDTNVFIGKGSIKDDLLGRAEHRHAGIQNCATLQTSWKLCSSISYQEMSSNYTAQPTIQNKGGAQLALSAKMNF